MFSFYWTYAVRKKKKKKKKKKTKSILNDS